MTDERPGHTLATIFGAWALLALVFANVGHGDILFAYVALGVFHASVILESAP